MKKPLLAIIIIILMVGICTGCGNSSTTGTSGSTNPGTRTITDSLGREVNVPAKIERIVPLGNAPRVITYLGLADKVVGYSGMDPSRLTPVTAYAYANKERWEGLPIVGTDSAGMTDYYPEQIISVEPDVIVCSYTKDVADEIQNKTGIPVVVVPMGTLFEQDYEQAIRLAGDVCGAPGRAEEVIAYINDSLNDLKSRASIVPATEKPSVLGAAATFKGAHGIEGVYTKYAVFEAILANDVTKGIFDAASVVIIDKEQIIEWDPEYIFFDSGGTGLVKADYADNPDFYAQLSAFQNENLYQYPSSTSYYSNIEIPIVNAYYVASLLYPDRFEDIDFENKANEVFRFFLGVENYLNELEEFGHDYGKVNLE